MTPHGPIYCETGHPWLFMAEPVNTITNGFIILAAFLAFIHVRRARIGFPPAISVLLFLLFATGIGSTLWHGLRTSWALQLDWMPGVAFLIVFTGLWMGQLFGRIAGVLGPLAMLAAVVVSVALLWHTLGAAQPTPSALRFAPGFVTIALVGLLLVYATNHKYGAAEARLGAIILLCGVTAAVFRSVDLLVCPIIPFGTHFLWHIFLSTASFLGIVLMVRMKVRGRPVFN
ncbi:MAG: ceramidase domain-containing protein [Alphaproteobacteria bacterium]|nr:ceramidase domain-containing protein [Alphaproteobacteria bacterium]MDE2110865.1 ceramidase domain-containing protein [Alphaproteobacteria bacterium]MDE2494094.1 ceramidase domain-containing protein [Alphaproteobacteria bacterium]